MLPVLGSKSRAAQKASRSRDEVEIVVLVGLPEVKRDVSMDRAAQRKAIEALFEEHPDVTAAREASDHAREAWVSASEAVREAESRHALDRDPAECAVEIAPDVVIDENGEIARCLISGDIIFADDPVVEIGGDGYCALAKYVRVDMLEQGPVLASEFFGSGDEDDQAEGAA